MSLKAVSIGLIGALSMSAPAIAAGSSAVQSLRSFEGKPLSPSGLLREAAFIEPAVREPGPLLYMSSTRRNLVSVYSMLGHDPVPIGKITGLSAPGGLAVDSKGNLWVRENGRHPVIAAFHRGSVTPFVTLHSNPGFGIAIDRHGTVYAATFSNVIEVYANGSRVPTNSLTDDNMSNLWNVAVDRSGNVFCNGDQNFVSETIFPLDEFLTKSATPIRLFSDLGDYEGLGVGRRDSLIVEAEDSISTYAKPYTRGPVSSFSYSAYLTPSVALALTASGRAIWTVNDNDQGQMWGEEFVLQSGRTLRKTSPQGLGYSPAGIAVDPPFPL